MPLYCLCFQLTLITIVHFRYSSVLDPILPSLAHHPPFHALLFSYANFLLGSIESFFGSCSYFCISSLDTELEGWCVGCIMHMYLCISSNSSHLVGRKITLLNYPLLLSLINFLLFFSVSLLEVNKVSCTTESIFTCSFIVINSVPCRRLYSVLFPSLLFLLPRWLLKMSVFFFFHLRVEDSNTLIPSGLTTLNKVLASVSAGLLMLPFPDFPFLDKRGSTWKLRKIVGEAWPHRNANPPFFNSIKEAIHSKSNNIAVNHSHFQTCFWPEKRGRIKCLLRGSSDEFMRWKSWRRRCEIPNWELFRNPGPALGWRCKTSSDIWM